MRQLVRLTIAIIVCVCATAYAKPLSVFACEPEWGALTLALAGDKVDIAVATTALQDPHHIQARPSLIAKARSADLLVCTGAELEIGWLPVLLRTSGNRRIQMQSSGYFMAAEQVALLDIPQHVDRSMGDVHAAGNPHLQLDPKRMLQVAEVLSERLQRLDPDNAQYYRQRLHQFKHQLQQTLAETQAARQRLRGKQFIVHHDNWPYLMAWLGGKQVATLEPKPGIPPSGRHLAKLLKQTQGQRVDAIIYASYQDPRPANWLASKIHKTALALANTVPNWQAPNALINWYRSLITTLDSKV